MNSPDQQRPQVLIVDDDPDIGSSLSSLLETEGYVVEVAAEGASAIAALEREPFNLVILDIALQQIDGFHIAGYLRKHWPNVRIAILSGMAERDVRSRFSDYDAFLTKSESSGALLATVARLAHD